MENKQIKNVMKQDRLFAVSLCAKNINVIVSVNMTIPDAIKLAIENGYNPYGEKYTIIFKENTGYWYSWKSEDEDGNEMTCENPTCWDHPTYFNALLLDPKFWQALSKGLGWAMYSEWPGHFNSDEEYLHDFTWRIKWHGLIDHLSAHNNIESYFAELK